jgi:hypothetical protein
MPSILIGYNIYCPCRDLTLQLPVIASHGLVLTPTVDQVAAAAQAVGGCGPYHHGIKVSVVMFVYIHVDTHV